MAYGGLKVVVTGADGFIGSHLTEMLVRHGAEVTALACYSSFDTQGWLDDLPLDILDALRVVRGDVRDSGFVRRLVQGQDIVFHLAALIAIPYSYAAPQSYVETNVLGTLNVLEAVRGTTVRRVVQTSTSEVYGTAITMPITESHPLQGQSPYSASKIGADMMAEAYARSFDVPVVILRPFNTFGPRQSERAVIPTVVRQLLDPTCAGIRIGDISTTRDFTFVTDTAAAFLAIGSAPGIQIGAAYNAGTGSAVSVGELIALAAEIAGCSKPVEQDAGRMRPASSEVRALLAGSERMNEATGWRARTTLRDGLTITIGWWRKRFENGQVRAAAGFMV